MSKINQLHLFQLIVVKAFFYTSLLCISLLVTLLITWITPIKERNPHASLELPEMVMIHTCWMHTNLISLGTVTIKPEWSTR